MNKKRAVQFIDAQLNELYPAPPIPLDHVDEYTLLIAVLLSAQCTDARVNLVTPALFSLASIPPRWPSRRSIPLMPSCDHAGSPPVRHGRFLSFLKFLSPNTVARFHPLLKPWRLCGVGHKTASVVMSQAFGHPVFPGGHSHSQTRSEMEAEQWKERRSNRKGSQAFVSEEKRWNALHLQIIYYAREHCPAHACHGLECIICKSCFPERKRKIKTQKA